MLTCLLTTLLGCVHYPPKIVYVDKIIEVPTFVETPAPTVYITPSELERENIEHPVLAGNTWEHALGLLSSYNESLNQCNARIDRIWLSVDGVNNGQ